MVVVFAKEKHKKNGFTLTELMIVVAIIGVLTTVVMQQVEAWRNRTYLAVAQAEARVLMLSLIESMPERDGAFWGGQILVNRAGTFVTRNWMGMSDFGGTFSTMFPDYSKNKNVTLGIGASPAQRRFLIEVFDCRQTGTASQRILRYWEGEGFSESNVQTVGTQHPRTRC